MANALYNPFKQKLLDNNSTPAIDMDADTIKATLIDSADYTFAAAHDEYSGVSADVATAAKVKESGALTSPTVTNGVFDTADFTWSAVSGDQSEAIILWDDTITTPADLLIAFYDTGMTGMKASDPERRGYSLSVPLAA